MTNTNGQQSAPPTTEADLQSPGFWRTVVDAENVLALQRSLQARYRLVSTYLLGPRFWLSAQANAAAMPPKARMTTVSTKAASWIGASELMHEPPLPDFRSI
jgi:hypothetical protein